MSKIEEIKEDFHAKYERERKEKLDNFPIKAENFKKKLKELKVKSFEVQYSGSGDSGEINEISYEPKKLNASIDVGTWTRWNNTTFEREETTDHKSLHDYIEDFCYDLLADNHGGWEINEGQSGNIDWNSKDNTIRHEYVSLVEEQYSEGF
tara:strand:+ start:290 stop:742 length:453 start_codon:yes stop_codon:yes gene_type:complete